MYKVNYYTLALMTDGTNGNINMGNGIAYMQAPIEKIPTLLNDHLDGKKRIGIVTEIKKVEGECIIAD
jgi:hypothetical protein